MTWKKMVAEEKNSDFFFFFPVCPILKIPRCCLHCLVHPKTLIHGLLWLHLTRSVQFPFFPSVSLKNAIGLWWIWCRWCTGWRLRMPFEGQEFDSLDDSQYFYSSYSKVVGLGFGYIRHGVQSSLIQCAFRHLFAPKKGLIKTQRGHPKPRNIHDLRWVKGCKLRIVITLAKHSKWVVSGFVKQHSHEMLRMKKTIE